jgi:hypothetical protein
MRLPADGNRPLRQDVKERKRRPLSAAGLASVSQLRALLCLIDKALLLLCWKTIEGRSGVRQLLRSHVLLIERRLSRTGLIGHGCRTGLRRASRRRGLGRSASGYRISLEQSYYASTSINLRLAAVRRLATRLLIADCSVQIWLPAFAGWACPASQSFSTGLSRSEGNGF